mgnify:FL=1
MLNAGYIEDWKFHNTNKGTPQGGNISPILANIYLDNFDKYMEEYALRFNKEKKDTSPKNTSNLAIRCNASLKASRTYRMQMSDYSLGMSMRN